MKTALSMAALFVLLAAGCESSSVAEQAKVTTSAKPTTRLYVRTTPPGAKIRIDGREKPETSPQLFDVPPGAKSMTVEVELGDHPGQRKVVVIEGGRIIRVEFKFNGKPERPPKKVHLPDADTAGAGVVLDLATGEVLKMQDPDDHVTAFSRLGRGDLFFDRALACLRGAKAMQWDGKRFVDLPAQDRRLDARLYMLPSVPCRLLITTAEKKHFDVTILALSKKDTGIDLEYREADPAVVPQPTSHFVCLVVGQDRMTFQGEDTNWEELPKLLEKIGDRRQTVLNIARAPGKITAEQWNEAQGKAVELVRRFDFQHLSIIGVHPLGSKGEGTRTLPGGKAGPPIEPPSAGARARLIWDRMMDPPKGWTIEKSFIVPPDQTAAIGKKLGGPIKRLSNTIYSAHGQRVQVNVIECWTNPDAEDIHKSVLAMKGDPAYALELGDTIVEFVGTFDVAFAKRLAKELLARKREPASFGPVVEQVLSDPHKAVAELLDLDTGRRVKREDFGRNDRETHRWIRDQRLDLLGARERAGAGVLLFDVAVWANPSLDWDKITAAEVRDHQALAQTEPQTITAVAAEDLSKLPLTCLFRTREGALGVLQLVGVEGPRAVKIRYKLVGLPDEQTVRQVIDKFVKACVEGDKGTVANLIHEKSRHLLEQIDDMQEIISAGIKPAEIDQIIVRGDRALAATKLTQLRHRQYPRPVCLVYTLEKQDGRWVLRDVDVEDRQGLADEIHRFNVRTSPRGEAREAESPAAAGRAKQLKANIDSFMLTLARYSGEQPPGPPSQSLVLHVPTNGFKHTRAVQIDKRQAEQIIDQLAAEGFLNSFHDMQEWKFIEAPRGAHYMLSVQAGNAHFAQYLSWNQSMLSRLQALRKVLRGDAAEAMDQLLAPPAPAEKGSPE